MSNMFEWNKTKCEEKKESEKPVKQEKKECDVVEKVVEKEEGSDNNNNNDEQEEICTLEEAAKVLGLSITSVRNKLSEYKIEPIKIHNYHAMTKKNLYIMKKDRVVAGLKDLAGAEDFELCEKCMERILK